MRLEKFAGEWQCVFERTNTSGKLLKLHRWPKCLSVGEEPRPKGEMLPDRVLPDGSIEHFSTFVGDPGQLFTHQQDSFVTLNPGETFIKR